MVWANFSKVFYKVFYCINCEGGEEIIGLKIAHWNHIWVDNCTKNISQLVATLWKALIECLEALPLVLACSTFLQ